MKIAVLAGGASAEAAISRSSAAGVVAALAARGHDVTTVELDAERIDVTGQGADFRQDSGRVPWPRCGGGPRIDS